MKLIYTSFIILLAFLCAHGQNQLYLNISHKLGQEEFELEKTSENDMGDAFKVERMQYYFAEISILHDGGQELFFSDLYALITATEGTGIPIDLGMHEVETVEKITFHIGVDEATNHLDPAKYFPDHPLAPKNPSMHWGWAGGYRFIAMEGKSGANLEDKMEMHVIGDGNYSKVEIPVNAVATDGILDINIIADYSVMMDGIDISQGIIRHGEIAEIVDFVYNFRHLVFRDISGTVNTEITNQQKVKIHPVPSSGQDIHCIMEKAGSYNVHVYNTNGQLVNSYAKSGKEWSIPLREKGQYIIRIIDDKNHLIAIHKHQVH